MKLIMAEPADPQGFEPKLKEAIEGLNDEVGEPSGKGDEFDGFVGMFTRLPKFAFANAVGADIRRETYK